MRTIHNAKENIQGHSQTEHVPIYNREREDQTPKTNSQTSKHRK